MPKTNYDQNNTIFALDIGTRTVIGLVVAVNNGSIKVLHQAMVEHQSRAMLDGQIHDIPRVAAAVHKVKAELEKKLKFPLSKVAIAAAGRSLKTIQCKVEQELPEDNEIDIMTVNSLELTGVQRAQNLLEQEELLGGEKFYCVGHSVVGYYLNDYPIANLEGHRGKRIAVDILATFLPASVVNSLYAVLARVKLEPSFITLEPIAACEVVIPEQLRLLNLALVDVGAGTSDIAITRDGTIKAYGMVPTAGDEITEVLVESLMVDFMAAEQIKRSLCLAGDIKYKDVLGMELTVQAANIIDLITPAVEKLAGEITTNIIELNGGTSPRSVFCVGGGAQVPKLVSCLAGKLGLPPERVALRNRTNINFLDYGKKKELSGPEGVTVVGIAALAAKKAGQNFISITVNQHPFTLFNTQKLTVLNALALLEFSPRDLLASNGRDIRFTINGKSKTVYGELGKPARITVNGKPASLQTQIRDGDVIQVERAVKGRDAVAMVMEVVADHLTEDEFTKIEDDFRKYCLLNGKPALPEEHLKTGDVLDIMHPTEDKMLQLNSEQREECIYKDPFEAEPAGNDIEVMVNQQPVILTGQREYLLIDIFNYIEIDTTKYSGSIVLKINGQHAEYTDVLQDGDNVEIQL